MILQEQLDKFAKETRNTVDILCWEAQKQVKDDYKEAIRDAINEIQHMSKNFDINQVDEWNSKSLACVIGRCSNWAVNIIRKHTGIGDNVEC